MDSALISLLLKTHLFSANTIGISPVSALSPAQRAHWLEQVKEWHPNPAATEFWVLVKAGWFPFWREYYLFTDEGLCVEYRGARLFARFDRLAKFKKKRLPFGRYRLKLYNHHDTVPVVVLELSRRQKEFVTDFFKSLLKHRSHPDSLSRLSADELIARVTDAAQGAARLAVLQPVIENPNPELLEILVARAIKNDGPARLACLFPLAFHHHAIANELLKQQRAFLEQWAADAQPDSFLRLVARLTLFLSSEAGDPRPLMEQILREGFAPELSLVFKKIQWELAKQNDPELEGHLYQFVGSHLSAPADRLKPLLDILLGYGTERTAHHLTGWLKRPELAGPGGRATRLNIQKTLIAVGHRATHAIEELLTGSDPEMTTWAKNAIRAIRKERLLDLVAREGAASASQE